MFVFLCYTNCKNSQKRPQLFSCLNNWGLPKSNLLMLFNWETNRKGTANTPLTVY